MWHMPESVECTLLIALVAAVFDVDIKLVLGKLGEDVTEILGLEYAMGQPQGL